ncbi:MAG: hypothetical protein J6P44_00450 [Bacteroidales bacterium]|nr:hypothetical protein [Bacteroidales bacterium]
MKKTNIIKTGLIALLTMAAVQKANATPQGPKHSPYYETDNTYASDPIGTATLLMLSLGGATLGYKLYKNNKEENDK